MMESGRKNGRERRGKRVNIVERQIYQKTSFHSILLHISRFFVKLPSLGICMPLKIQWML